MKLKRWETALMMALCVTVLCGAAVLREQRQLADRLIRLHVIANSDSEDDQALKLDIRDRVVEELGALLDGVTERGAAIDIITENMDAVIRAASGEISARGYDYGVSAAVGTESFPTREYDTFTLPAGRYESLRVEIGQAGGQNWWCVVFPPLCADSADDAKAALNALSADGISLIAEDSSDYKIKFKMLEWMEKARLLLQKEK